MNLKERFIFNFIESDRWKYLWDGLGATLKVTFFALILGVELVLLLQSSVLPMIRISKT